MVLDLFVIGHGSVDSLPFRLRSGFLFCAEDAAPKKDNGNESRKDDVTGLPVEAVGDSEQKEAD
jgi:hypothetical protein